MNGYKLIKKKEYKGILGKSMPPYTNLSLFLIISSKNYICDTKILTKGAATVVFVRKVAQGSSFKKDSQFNSHFLHLHMMLRLCRFINFSLLFFKLPLFFVIRQTAIIRKDKTQFLLFHTRKKIILNLFLFVEYVNLDYIQWT